MKKEAIPIHELPEKQSGKLYFHFIEWGEPDQLYDSSVPHRHQYNEMLLFYKGSGKHEIDFLDHPIAGQTLHFVASGQAHLVKRSKDSSGCSFIFSDEFFYLNQPGSSVQELPFYQASARPVARLDEESFNRVSALTERIKEEFNSDRKHKEDMIRSLLYIIFIEIKRSGVSPEGEAVHQKDVLIQQFKKLIDQHYKDQHGIREYADMLNISSNYLNERCRKICGKTASSLVQERILLEAKRLLFHTGESIKEIAFALNFEDPAYFTRFFKKHTNVSPADYRRSQP